jgi:hypothetical protein
MRVDHENKQLFVRQSWLGDTLICPRRGKYSITLPQMRRGSSETALGTGFHTAIETILRDGPQDGYVEGIDLTLILNAINNGVRSYRHEMGLNVMVTQDWDDETVYALLESMVYSWAADISPHVPRGGEIEKKFQFPLNEFAINGYSIFMEGTADYVAPDGTLWDWKTAKRKYSAREKQLQSVQASMYTMMLAQTQPADEYLFNFGVVIRSEKSSGHITTVRRTPNHHGWLARQTVGAVNAMFSAGDLFMNDNHFLCSEKWCPWYSVCRGAHITASDDMVVDSP